MTTSPLKALLVHAATVQIRADTNTSGRVTTEWVDAGVIDCRFTIPSVASFPIVQGATEPMFTTQVFTGLELLDIVDIDCPFRLVTDSGMWSGTYEVRNQPRVYSDHHLLHHVELDVVRVENG